MENNTTSNNINKDFYDNLPEMACMLLDNIAKRYSKEPWFAEAWNLYRQHVKNSSMDTVRMPGFIFKKYIKHSFYCTPDYICHWGIKGQKWGIRRYQNEDGTLTPEGKAKYGTADNLKAHNKKVKSIIAGAAITAAVVTTAAIIGKKHLDAASEVKNVLNYKNEKRLAYNALTRNNRNVKRMIINNAAYKDLGALNIMKKNRIQNKIVNQKIYDRTTSLVSKNILRCNTADFNYNSALNSMSNLGKKFLNKSLGL